MTRRPNTAALLAAIVFAAGCTASKPPAARTDPDRAALAARVREELLHAWRAYERYAWGHDELKPVSRTPRDWYGNESPSPGPRYRPGSRFSSSFTRFSSSSIRSRMP